MGEQYTTLYLAIPLYPKKESAYNQALTSFPNPKHVGVELALGPVPVVALGPVPVAALGPVLVEPVLLGLVLLEGILEGGVLVLVVLVGLVLLEVLVLLEGGVLVMVALEGRVLEKPVMRLALLLPVLPAVL